MKRKIIAFIFGVIEFRSDITSSFDYDLIETYDWGRELMHRLTFRRWEQ